MLKKQMQSMSITTNKSQSAAAKKLNMADESSSDEDEETMQGVTSLRAAAVPRLAASSKNRISKHKDGISRAREVSLKK